MKASNAGDPPWASTCERAAYASPTGRWPGNGRRRRPAVRTRHPAHPMVPHWPPVSLVAMQERASSAPQRGPGERLHAASWLDGGVVFEHGRLAAPRIDTLSSSTSTHRLVLTETGGTSRTYISVDGRTVYDGFDRPGALTFIPASAERRSSYWDADLSYSSIWISPALLDSLSGTPELSPLQGEVNRGDEVVGTLLRSLRSAVSLGRPPGAVYVEHLAVLALLHMAAMPPGTPDTDRSSKLDQKALDCVFAYVDAHLASDIRLSELAALTGLPMDTFARRFRASVGQPPYRYVLGRRVERAGQLLRETDTSISVVALATGFSSQSHLTSVFKHLTGTTPRAYRRGQRPGS